MTLSIGHFRRPILVLMATGWVLVALSLSCLIMEQLTRWVEVHQDGYLWREEEWLQILIPDLYVGKGRGRLLICGSSEAREAFLPDRFSSGLRGLKAYQNAHAHSGLPDLLILLQYLERVYGSSALPDAMLLGISSRYVSNIQLTSHSLLFEGINRYSPDLQVKVTSGRPKLVTKTGFESQLSRLRLIRKLTHRYRPAVHGLRQALLVSLRPDLVHDFELRVGLTPSRFHHRPPWKPEAIRAYLQDNDNNWREVHGWDVSRDRDRVHRQLAELLDFARRHDIDLYVINLPEISASRRLYRQGVYEAYLQELHNVLDSSAFLDLRTFLNDEDFYDATHPTLAGALKVTDHVVKFIAARRELRNDEQRIGRPDY